VDLRELPQVDFTRHPWEVARAEFFTELVCKRLNSSRPQRIVDIGAGDGYLAQRLLSALPKGSAITCVDINYREADLPRLNAQAQGGLSFTRKAPDSPVDCLLLLDVLEHVEDDIGLLREMSETLLSVGGSAVVSVPAWPSLYVEHDVSLGHCRRYRPESLASVMTTAGLRIEQSGGLFTSLLLPRALQKLLELARGVVSKPGLQGPAERAKTEVGDWRGGALLTRIIKGGLMCDYTMTQLLGAAGLRLAGLSTWAVGSKLGGRA
jgi:2-polyprenyl-3-methyl-5-hydroxy-6-metoxy-1,4-benzoquinol methylase